MACYWLGSISIRLFWLISNKITYSSYRERGARGKEREEGEKREKRERRGRQTDRETYIQTER